MNHRCVLKRQRNNVIYRATLLRSRGSLRRHDQEAADACRRRLASRGQSQFVRPALINLDLEEPFCLCANVQPPPIHHFFLTARASQCKEKPCFLEKQIGTDAQDSGTPSIGGRFHVHRIYISTADILRLSAAVPIHPRCREKAGKRSPKR